MLDRLTHPFILGEGVPARVAWALATLLVLVHIGLGWEAREIGVHIMRDDARYLILAQSLREFGYHDLYRVSQPLHTLYPPGYPLLLLTWGTVFGDSFATHVMLNVLLSGAALALLFAALKRLTSPGVALLCLVPLVANPLLVSRAGSLRSEPMYMFFSLLALWALARAHPGVRALVLAGGAALLAAAARINGLTLVAAIGLAWLFKRRFKAFAVLAAVSVLTMGTSLVWAALTPEALPESSYVGDVLRGRADPRSTAEILWARTGLRAWRVFVETLRAALPLPSISGTPVDNLVLTGAMIVSLLAGIVVWLRRWTEASLYLLLYFLSLFTWPFVRPRFVEPILPLLVPAVVLGAAALAGAYRRSLRLPAAAVLVLLLTVTGSLQTAQRVSDRAGCEPFDLADPPACLSIKQSSYLRAVDHIDKTTPTDAVFLGVAPEPLYYHTGRQSISSAGARRTGPSDFLAYLMEQGVDYVLLTANSGWISDRLAAHCSHLALEGTFPPRTYLLRIASPDETVSPTSACEAVAEHRQRAE
jgi:hypothetical protein